ncbi:MAG: ABC transporter permease, partial [Verrucomicrobiota bacterium]|nr:ABC transporter permease [Verrucomicrobiota bacterium]
MKRKVRFLTEVRESVLMAFRAVASHKLRSILTLLGILVGVFSIILVMTAMRALQGYVEDELSGLGANTAQIKKWPSINFEGPASWEKYARRTNLDYDQFKKLRARATLARGVSIIEGFRTDEASSRFDTSNPDVRLHGVTGETFSARNLIIEEGRAITDTDVESRRNVCIPGYELAQKLFPHSSALGETIRFDSINYLVVGVLEKKGSLFDAGSDNMLLIPLTTAMNYYGHRRSMNFLIEAHDRKTYEDTIEQVRGALRNIRRLKPTDADDFEIESNDSLIQQFQSVTFSIRIGITVVSSIALVAAGIGIMNIMLVSVTERTREIGVRRAIGAKKRNIMTQFIMEAVVLCQMGGVAGVLLGVMGGNAAARILKVPMTLPVDWVVIGLVICSVVGIIFGSYPAWKAANLDPIDSLR